MIWFRVGRLVEQLKSTATAPIGKVDDDEALKYLIGNMVILTLGSVGAQIAPEATTPNPSVIAFDLVLQITATVAAVIWAFRENRRGDSKDFFKRFICLSFPITLTLGLLALPVMGLGLVGASMMGIEKVSMNSLTLVIDLIQSIAYAVWISRAMASTAAP